MKIEDELNKMRILIEKIKKADQAYYGEDREIMSNLEYDNAYAQLEKLEEINHTVLSGSPTSTPGCAIMGELTKVKHEVPALSLSKTKDREELRNWLGDKEGILSVKLDGLTSQATYEDGILKNVVTRGNGEIGEDITHNAVFFNGLPKKIAYKGKLIVRGEALITYSEFERINAKIEDVAAKYKNPRNLASGTVRQLDSNIVSKRVVSFKAFALAKGDDLENSYYGRLRLLEELGFDVVQHILVTKDTLLDQIEIFEKNIATSDVPSDGLVLIYDDISYGESLGSTGKFPRNGKAFKWQDETIKTILREVEWSASRLGTLNPVAIFDSVELEGTSVARANVHNVSIVKNLELGIGDELLVYKANMIIPQVLQNNTRSNTLEIPEVCPVCGSKTVIRKEKESEVLFCENPDCLAKNIGRIAHFTGRDAMNMEGLSEATLEKLIDAGCIHNIKGLFDLEEHKDKIQTMEGFGKKSYENMIASIDEGKNRTFDRFLYALGIPNVGRTVSKQINKEVKGIHGFTDWLNEKKPFFSIEGVGEIINDSIYKWFDNEEKKEEFEQLVLEINFTDVFSEKSAIEQPLLGQTFVITGSVEQFANRDALKVVIEDNGGKVLSSVSAKLNYLINNDTLSNSSKNRKAKELGIPIISEEDFLKLI